MFALAALKAGRDARAPRSFTRKLLWNLVSIIWELGRRRGNIALVLFTSKESKTRLTNDPD
jgi:hypothetical protein